MTNKFRNSFMDYDIDLFFLIFPYEIFNQLLLYRHFPSASFL
jgi:hypothetical protein